MSSAKRLVYSTIGRKIIMGATGLFLCLFLVAHLSGNLLLFRNDGGVAFDEYATFMATNRLVRGTEIILFLGFFFHIIDSIVLTLRNRRARPAKYVANAPFTTWASRNMGITGSIIFIFLAVHINTFFVKHRILGTQESMYETVQQAFERGWGGWYWAFYVVAMVLLGIHLSHGFRSAFQSLGLSHQKYRPFIEKVGLLFSILIPAGFAAMPLYFFLAKP